MNSLKQKILIFLALFLMTNCSTLGIGGKKEEKEEVVVKKIIEHDKKKASEQYKGTFFQGFGKSGGTTYEFATSNVLWRATLNTLDFIPLQSANYSGGILVTDWYSKDNNDESIKIEVRFLSSELSATSIEVISYKKKCKIQNCSISKIAKNFNEEIKLKILASARSLNLRENSKK